MKYDPEYNSYKFNSEEVSTIIHSLISYSQDSFLDHISKKNVKLLLESMNKSATISVPQ